MPAIQIYSDADALASAAADLFLRLTREAFAAQGQFTAALTGGSTPENTYTRIAAAADQPDWEKVTLFIGDERFVPPADPRSNYGMARRAMLDRLPSPGPKVFPVNTAAPTVEEAARQYADALAERFSLPVNTAPPVFDLILLGLGEDGHAASLFPGKPTLSVTDRWTVSSPPGMLPPPVDRVTFTYPVLNAARQVIFLVAGEKKAQAVRDILEGGTTKEVHPAAGVQPASGTLTWLLDKGAAGLLSSEMRSSEMRSSEMRSSEMRSSEMRSGLALEQAA